MKLSLNFIGLLLLVCTVALLILCVWTQDGRFAVTAGILSVPTVVVFVVAGWRAHVESCPGC